MGLLRYLYEILGIFRCNSFISSIFYNWVSRGGEVRFDGTFGRASCFCSTIPAGRPGPIFGCAQARDLRLCSDGRPLEKIRGSAPELRKKFEFSEQIGRPFYILRRVSIYRTLPGIFPKSSIFFGVIASLVQFTTTGFHAFYTKRKRTPPGLMRLMSFL